MGNSTGQYLSRLFPRAVLIALVGLVMAAASLTTNTSAASITIAAAADAHVVSDRPDRNAGTATALRVDASPIERAYLKFNVAQFQGTVQKATLSVYNRSSSNSGYTLQTVSNTSWSETTIAYNNAPPPGVVVGSSGGTTTGSWTSFDVSAVVRSAGTYSFVITRSSTTSATLSSRETGETGPRLVIETSGSITPSPAKSPTVSPVPSSTLPPAATAKPSVTPPPSGGSTASPIRAAFYYPWFSESWTQSGVYPYTNYVPTLGYYSSSDSSVVRRHIEAMQYGKISAGISSWWGQGHRTDTRVPLLLSTASGTGFKWTLYYERESTTNPSVSQIRNDLIYIRDRYASDPSFLKINGKFVVFVYAASGDGCAMADRWKQANATIGAYVVLKVFSGYRYCASQPDGWHQYSPATSADQQSSYSYSISPGFWQKGQSVRLARDLERWQRDVRNMASSGAQFQLITTFNEWGEGTSVESATAWSSASGYGKYLDALRNDGQAGGTSASPTPAPTATPSPVPVPGEATLLAVGDIASCSVSGDEAVAQLLSGLAGTIATLGDTVYESGTNTEFANCFDPAFGPLKSRIRPAVGNHEYKTPGASGYYDYFGVAAGDPSKGYYSYNLGAWHIVVLNSNCSEVGGCGTGSPQEQWLRSDLAANPGACKLAYWHHPRYSSGPHGSHPSVSPLWKALLDHDATVVLSGHDHNYERFASMDQNGNLSSNGIRQFVVGTGGKNHYAVGPLVNGSEVHNDDTFGVLKLTLRSDSYSWEFVPIAGGSYTDSGTASCNR